MSTVPPDKLNSQLHRLSRAFRIFRAYCALRSNVPVCIQETTFFGKDSRMADALIERFKYLRVNSLSRVNPVIYCPVNPQALLAVVCEREAIPSVKYSSLLKNGGFLWELGDTALEWAVFTDYSKQVSFAPFFLVNCRDTAHASQAIASIMRACEQASLLGVERENVNGEEISARLSSILATGRGVPNSELL